MGLIKHAKALGFARNNRTSTFHSSRLLNLSFCTNSCSILWLHFGWILSESCCEIYAHEQYRIVCGTVLFALGSSINSTYVLVWGFEALSRICEVRHWTSCVLNCRSISLGPGHVRLCRCNCNSYQTRSCVRSDWEETTVRLDEKIVRQTVRTHSNEHELFIWKPHRQMFTYLKRKRDGPQMKGSNYSSRMSLF